MQSRSMLFIMAAAAVSTGSPAIAAPKPPARPAARPAAPIARPAPPVGKISPPKARYDMDVGTTTGLAALAGKGAGGALSMAFGGGRNSEARELLLRLGSVQSAAGGAPKADHFVMPQAKLGKSLPLLSPAPAEAERDDPAEPALPKEFQRPKGRMLLFWGCGEHAPKGQPVIIDFSKLSAAQVPPNLFSTRVPIDRGPTARTSGTYGEWPNAKSGKPPSTASSLIGDHRIVSNYAPEIKFSLTQDFMAGLRAVAGAVPSGAQNLSWNSIPNATGYYAWVFAMKAGERGDAPQDLVLWSSSSAQEFGAGLWDWLPPATVARLVSERVVMPSSQTTCLVPAEVKAAGPDFMIGNMTAFGPEANFAYPPRPADPALPWAPDWTARVRYRSNTSWLIGGPQIGGAPGEDAKPACKPSVFGVLTGRGC